MNDEARLEFLQRMYKSGRLQSHMGEDQAALMLREAAAHAKKGSNEQKIKSRWGIVAGVLACIALGAVLAILFPRISTMKFWILWISLIILGEVAVIKLKDLIAEVVREVVKDTWQDMREREAWEASFFIDDPGQDEA